MASPAGGGRGVAPAPEGRGCCSVPLTPAARPLRIPDRDRRWRVLLFGIHLPREDAWTGPGQPLLPKLPGAPCPQTPALPHALPVGALVP